MLLSSWSRDDAHDAVEFGQSTSCRAPAEGGIEPQLRVAAVPSPDLPRRIESEIPFLRRSVRRWHREAADADDLVQDTLLRALASAHLWQPGSDLRAWLFTIMRNQFFALATKSYRLASALEQFGAAAAADWSANSPEARLTLHDVAAALNRLPGKQRAAVLLVGIEGKSYEEAAADMGISAGAVRCHLARGRERLRAAVRGAAAGSPVAQRPLRTPMPPRSPSHLRFQAAPALMGAD